MLGHPLSVGYYSFFGLLHEVNARFTCLLILYSCSSEVKLLWSNRQKVKINAKYLIPTTVVSLYTVHAMSPVRHCISNISTTCHSTSSLIPSIVLPSAHLIGLIIMTSTMALTNAVMTEADNGCVRTSCADTWRSLRFILPPVHGRHGFALIRWCCFCHRCICQCHHI